MSISVSEFKMPSELSVYKTKSKTPLLVKVCNNTFYYEHRLNF